jgi:hypothetical protein
MRRRKKEFVALLPQLLEGEDNAFGRHILAIAKD